MNRYFEFPPTGPLNRYLVCSWEHTFEGDWSHSHKIFPDGCVDIILIGDSPPLVVGPDTRARIASFYGPTQIVGIRLTPGIAGAVLHENVQSVVDQEVPLEDLWGSRAPKFRHHASHEEKKKLLESIVLYKLLTPDGRVMDAVRAFLSIQIREPRNSPLSITSRRGNSCDYLPRTWVTAPKCWRVSSVFREHSRSPLPRPLPSQSWRSPLHTPINPICAGNFAPYVWNAPPALSLAGLPHWRCPICSRRRGFRWVVWPHETTNYDTHSRRR